MDPTAVLYPALAMFFLTFTVIIYMGVARYTAVVKGQVKLKFYRLFKDGEQPERLELLARHVQNHFEVPPLFYLALLFIYVTGQVSLLKVVLAWLYFASRCLHTYIHLGSNNVWNRFRVFGLSLGILLALWLSLLGSLLG